mmetsp:Transcript_27935/g.67962  ORF Transcript_27935/g.67962 Transcript_27935/m.67962 type:complete len:869 (-) Transcript_27935:61-2667(-)
MRVVQTPHRPQWGNHGGATTRGYGTAQQRPVLMGGRLPVASPTATGNTMSPTGMRMVRTGMNNRKYAPPPLNILRPPQTRVESRQVPVSPPQVPKKQSSVIDLTDIDERDIDNLQSKRTAPMISQPKTNRPMINPPRRYQYQIPPASKQQKPHVPKVMPEQGRKPRATSHHSEVQRLPVAPASKHTAGSPWGAETGRSPKNNTNEGKASTSSKTNAGQASTTNRASQRLAVASASRSAQKSRPVERESRNETKRAPSQDHSMSIADRLRAINDSRPGHGQKDSDSIKKDTIDGPLPRSTRQPKKEVQPSFDSAYNSAYSAYTSCTEYTNYTEPSMDSDITPFDTANARRNRDYGVENELLQHTSGKLAAESTDEFDTKACLIATRELTELLANDVKEVADFAQSTFTGENQNADAASIDTPEKQTEVKSSAKSTTKTAAAKTESNEKPTKTDEKETDPTKACLAGTQDCMMSFQEDVTFVASKLQEACLPDGEEESTSIADGNKNKAAKETDESGCVNGTSDCMQSFREDVSYVAGLGATTVLGKQGSTSVVEGTSGQRLLKDDDSDVFAATADCFVQLKDDIKFSVAQMKGMKLSEIEVRGLVVSIAQGLNEPLFLTEGDGDTGSVLTDDFRSSTASVNDLDSLDDSQDARSAADSAPSISGMSADLPVDSGESIVDSIKQQLEFDSLKGEEFLDPVIEEIKKVDPPGDDDEEVDYAIAATRSSNGRADPPASDKPFDELPSLAPGDANEDEESTGASDDEDIYIEETEEVMTMEETIEEEVLEEETVEEEIEEEIEEQNANETLEVVDEEEENVTLETEMETVETPDDELDVEEKSESTATQESVLVLLENKTDDVPFPDLLPDEI